MDLTEFGLDKIEAGESSGGGERVKPGRYNFEYAGSEELQNDKGWKALKIHFDVEGEIIKVSHAFTMVNPNSAKQVEIGKQSLMKMLNAMGVSSIKNSNELLGKKVEGELVVGEKGYLEIKDDFGNGWKAYGSTATKENADPKEELPKEEMFPSDVEDEDDLPF
jgi:hypothetical protein